MNVKKLVEDKPKFREMLILLIAGKRTARPRLWVRLFLNPFIYSRGKGSKIHWMSARLDLFPWHKFHLGNYSTIESRVTLTNGAGDISIGDNVRIGIGDTVIGPVTIGDGCLFGQHVFIAGFNHGYQNPDEDSRTQPLDKRPVVIGDGTFIGSNSSVVAGVTIGKRCQIGAGSVVTKDLPDYCVAVGNPARIIKQYDFEQKAWVKKV